MRRRTRDRYTTEQFCGVLSGEDGRKFNLRVRSNHASLFCVYKFRQQTPSLRGKILSFEFLGCAKQTIAVCVDVERLSMCLGTRASAIPYLSPLGVEVSKPFEDSMLCPFRRVEVSKPFEDSMLCFFRPRNFIYQERRRKTQSLDCHDESAHVPHACTTRNRKGEILDKYKLARLRMWRVSLYVKNPLRCRIRILASCDCK